MRKLFVCAAIFFSTHTTQGQSTGDIFRQQAGQGIKEAAKTLTENAGEKVTDKLLNKLFGKRNGKINDKNTTKSSSVNNTDTTGINSKTGNAGNSSSFQAYSKFDFIPGDKIIAYEDFSQDAIGDFPDKWNTNSTGELVTFNNETPHWLSLNKQGRFLPEFIQSLPDNFTLQFTIQCNPDFNDYSSYFRVWMLSGGQNKDEFSSSFINDNKRSGAEIAFVITNSWNHSGRGRIYTYQDGSIVINGDVNEIGFFNNLNKKQSKSIHPETETKSSVLYG